MSDSALKNVKKWKQ